MATPDNEDDTDATHRCSNASTTTDRVWNAEVYR